MNNNFIKLHHTILFIYFFLINIFNIFLIIFLFEFKNINLKKYFYKKKNKLPTFSIRTKIWIFKNIYFNLLQL